MALKFPLSFGLALALALAGAPRSAIGEDQGRGAPLQGLRITALISELADQARASDDLLFALKTQSKAAILLMPYDRAGGRAIFRRVFDTLSDLLADFGAENRDKIQHSSNTPSRADLDQLRADLLIGIAGRDPELAEELGRVIAFADSDRDARTDSDPPAHDIQLPNDGRGARDSVRRELLITVALQIVDREPQRAMTLAQLSLADGVSPNLVRLMLLMRAIDKGLTDSLFSNAAAEVERSGHTSLADVHILGTYLVSLGNMASDETNPATLRFLNFALALMPPCSVNTQGCPVGLASAGSPPSGSPPDDNAAAYFLGRQLAVLLSRYLPSRVPELEKKIASLNQQGGLDVQAESIRAQGQQLEGPADTESRASVLQNEDERDRMFARAALAWLERGNVAEAQNTAFRISDAGLHDRVLAQIVRKQTSEGKIEDAVATSQRIEQDTARVGLLVRLASAALASSDRDKAEQLLDDAEAEANKGEPSLARAEDLLTVVAAFSAFDSIRAFEVMHSAVKAINDLPAQKKEGWRAGQPSASSGRDGIQDGGPGEISDRLNFDGTLGVLARSDYDRALLLARGLIGKEVSITAQLAACRGGLAPAAYQAGKTGSGAETDASQQRSPR